RAGGWRGRGPIGPNASLLERLPGYCPRLRWTMAGNEQFDWLRAPSVALHRTSVTPGGKKIPDGGSHTTDGDASRSSLAVTVKVTISPGGPEGGSGTVTDVGQDRRS